MLFKESRAAPKAFVCLISLKRQRKSQVGEEKNIYNWYDVTDNRNYLFNGQYSTIIKVMISE